MFPCTKNSRFIAISAQVKSENAQVNAQVNVKHVQVETCAPVKLYQGPGINY